RHDPGGVVELVVPGRPAALGTENAQRYPSLFSELDRVREQVLEDLLQALGVGLDHRRQAGLDLDGEIEALVLGKLAETLGDVLVQVRETLRRDIERDGARLDLREVEDVVDERE